jgi:vanillate O-demethylase ferredoxin subunit
MKASDQRQTYTLRSTRQITPGVREFELLPESGTLPAYTAGSHVTVEVMLRDPSGASGGLRPALRSYSLVGSNAGKSGADSLRIAVRLIGAEAGGRGGSAWMWNQQPGARLSLGQPANHFELAPDVREVLLLAGGIGITPLVSMAEVLAGRPDVAVRLLYLARSAEELAYGEQLRVLLGDQRLHTVIGQGADLVAEFARLGPAGQCYLCGPVGLRVAAQQAWAAAGRSAVDLRFETFGTSGRHPSQAFTVELPRHGLTLQVPAERSLLEVLEDAGIGVLADCRRGECGLCAMTVLGVAGGVIDHRDVYLSAAEQASNRRVCACVSRAAGGPDARLVLDTAYRADALPEVQTRAAVLPTPHPRNTPETCPS